MQNTTNGTAELAQQHGGAEGEHPGWTDALWRDEVRDGHTRQGYWAWVADRIDAEGQSPA